MAMAKAVQAKDVPEFVVLDFLKREGISSTDRVVYYALGNRYPRKVVAAKLAALLRRRLVDGCPCGCRGDWVWLPPPPIDVEAREVSPKEITR